VISDLLELAGQHRERRSQLVDEGVAAEKSAATDRDGNFVILKLQPRSYRITATVQGFQTAIYSGVAAETARLADVVIRMAAGVVSETVEVNEVATILEAASMLSL
jgi:hypothetical protein